MKRNLKHIMAGFKTGDKAADNTMVKICGERWSIYVCDEPYWMGEHTWHVDSLSGMQWGWRIESGRRIEYPPAGWRGQSESPSASVGSDGEA